MIIYTNSIVYARGKCYREGAETRDFTKALKDHQTHLQLAIKLNDPVNQSFLLFLNH
jgi:hypothetical protein